MLLVFLSFDHFNMNLERNLSTEILGLSFTIRVKQMLKFLKKYIFF